MPLLLFPLGAGGGVPEPNFLPGGAGMRTHHPLAGNVTKRVNDDDEVLLLAFAAIEHFYGD